jgi:hypothetical protein
MYSVISEQNISTTGMLILVCTASLVERTSVQQEWQYYHSLCPDVLCTDRAVLTSITIPVVPMFCLLKYISGQNISTTGIVLLVSTGPLVDRTSVQQEWFTH